MSVLHKLRSTCGRSPHARQLQHGTLTAGVGQTAWTDPAVMCPLLDLHPAPTHVPVTTGTMCLPCISSAASAAPHASPYVMCRWPACALACWQVSGSHPSDSQKGRSSVCTP